MGNKDLLHVVTPSPVRAPIVIGDRLHWVPANTVQVISLRATGARHARGARFGEVVYSAPAVEVPPVPLGIVNGRREWQRGGWRHV